MSVVKGWCINEYQECSSESFSVIGPLPFPGQLSIFSFTDTCQSFDALRLFLRWALHLLATTTHPDLFVDGAYTGQTQDVFEYQTMVNDSDGVDVVLFRFKWEGDDDWLNGTTVRTEGDEFQGTYKGNLSWPAPGGGTFQFKVFANDTLGNWNETSPMTVHFGYLYFPFYYIPQFWLLVTCVLIVPPLTLVAVRRLKRRVSGYSKSFRQLQAGGMRTSVKLVLTGLLAFVALLSTGYTLSMAGGSLNAGLGSVQAAHGVLGVSVGLIAVVVPSYIMVQVLKM
ncbi:MAG: hypothetical protein ACE5H4_01190 [Candidatus Thorarchaeota archaeon]